jgi:hypothetical protein
MLRDMLGQIQVNSKGGIDPAVNQVSSGSNLGSYNMNVKPKATMQEALMTPQAPNVDADTVKRFMDSFYNNRQ